MTEARSLEEVLLTEGILIWRIKGVSMRPFLKSEKDQVVIRRTDLVRPDGRFLRGDVLLYKRGNDYVLHRVIRAFPDRLKIAGDNTERLENVPVKNVLGIMTEVLRDGEKRRIDTLPWKLYTVFWGGKTGLFIRRCVKPILRRIKKALKLTKKM